MSRKSIIKAGYEDYLATRRLDDLTELSNGITDPDPVRTLSAMDWYESVKQQAARNLLRRIVDAQRSGNSDSMAGAIAQSRVPFPSPYLAVYDMFTLELVNVLVDHLVEVID